MGINKEYPQMIDTELKPCPLCGGEVQIFDFAGHEILCDCGILFATVNGDREITIKAWNTRIDTHATTD